MKILKRNDRLIDIPLEDIAPNKNQPRQYFSDDTLNDLSCSIMEFGVLQPITVRKTGNKYELISGERRFRASQLAGLEKIPAIVVESDEKKSAVLSLLENLQREDLTFFEIAQSYERLIHEQGMTQNEVAEKMGKSQSSVANKLRLLRLSPMIRKLIRDYDLSERHARALLKLKSESQQFEVIKNICVNSLSVSETDEMIDKMLNPPKSKLKEIQNKGGTKNFTLFKNAMKKAVDIMNKNGVETDMEEKEYEWGKEYRISIKNDKTV